MSDQSERARRGFALSQPGDPLGVSCDEHGPSLGPIRLLDKGAFGFWPRPIEDLDAILSAAFEEPIACERLVCGLEVVARALQAKDMARAMFATQFLRLPDFTEEQARRAIATEVLRKASPDNVEHPGWPAGAPHRQGGRFRSKEGNVAAPGPDNSAAVHAQAAEEKLKEMTKRRLLRGAVKALMKKFFTWKRLLRLGAEIGSNAVPGADVVGDAAMIADILEVARESEALAEEVKEAMEFMDKGPYTIEELQASTDYREFSSYDAFRKIDVKKVYRSAGEGKDWHHIVEQGLKGDTIPQEQLQSTENIVRIPRIIHEMISSESSSPSDGSGVRLRDQLRGRPFGEKYQAGLNALKKIGILKD